MREWTHNAGSRVAGASSGRQVFSLEHKADWYEWVMLHVRILHLQNVFVSLCPLRSYGPFDWYSTPPNAPTQFSLVVCDGPPASTRGGRAGLLSVMGDRLSGATVLLDDIDRPGEQAAVHQWHDEWGLDMRRVTARSRSYGLGRVPESAGGEAAR